MVRKTKIICTIGPATKREDTIISLIKNGMNVARLNFSHGDYSEHEELINNIRSAAETVGKEIPIIGDLGGPKVRVGELADDIMLIQGEIVLVSYERIHNINHKNLPVNYERFARDVKVGDRVLIDDGLIKLKIIKIEDDRIFCEVIDGGRVSSRKGVNLPDSTLSIECLTAKDRDDIEFALDQKLDFLALSFVRNSSDIEKLRSYLSTKSSPLPIIAKIEKPEAIRDIENIIKTSDMIMIARGDLGVEMSPYEVPILQKEIIRKCLFFKKPVITATQMLESMIHNPRSTRAEASDIANALFDGTDAVMLSGETSIGQYPEAAVKTMHSILLRAEKTDYIFSPLFNGEQYLENSQFAINLSRAACWIAKETRSTAILAMTKTGRTARLLSGYRTATPIIAFSPHKSTVTALKLNWGVESVLIDSFSNTDENLAQAKEYALQKGVVKKGDTILYIVGDPIEETEEINMIKIEKV